MRIGRRLERGDTLIEVLVAVVALSVIVTLAYTIMTRSFAQGQIALERTTTQGMVAAQISMLRDTFARHEQAVRSGASVSSTDWNTIVKSFASGGFVQEVTAVNANAVDSCTFRTNRRFYFDPTTTVQADKIKPTVFVDANMMRQATLPKYGDGLWIEGYKITPTTGAKPYYDFYVKACWDAAISGERQTVVTNVRFYEIY